MTLAHVGPIARNVADAALVLKVIAGPDRRDPFSLMAPIGPEPNAEAVRKLRVAFSPTLGFAKVEPPVARVVANAVDRLRSVFPTMDTVAEVCPDVGDIHRALFLGAISARLGDLVATSPKLIEPLLLAAVKRFREMDADAYTRLQRKQFEVREVLRQFFERYDLLLTPTTPCVAWDVEQLVPPGLDSAVPFTRPFNHTGQPAASVPCGLTPANLPVGLQIVAPLGDEATLIAALRVVEGTLSAGLITPLEIAKRLRKSARSGPSPYECSNGATVADAPSGPVRTEVAQSASEDDARSPSCEHCNRLSDPVVIGHTTQDRSPAGPRTKPTRVWPADGGRKSTWSH
jgi:Asp-tRNA(Asn)/Glu-tRNA(Gln) amidotransferase A subunit family amidase